MQHRELAIRGAMTGKSVEDRVDETSEWSIVPALKSGGEGFVQVERSAKRVFVGAGARILFYPTLFYNVVRNQLQAEFRWWDQIDQHLLLGAVPFPGDVHRLKAVGVEAVVTLNESYETLVPASMYQDEGIDHLVIPTRDYLFAPSVGDIRRAVEFIHGHFKNERTTYVHCKAGRGRSTTVVLCYLVEHRGMTPMDAFRYVRAKRPRVLLAPAQWQAVQDYSEQIDPFCGPIRSVHLSQRLASSAEARKPLNCANLLSAEPFDTSLGRSKLGPSDIEELPVVITGVDLTGYRSVEDAGLIGNDLWRELGVVYRARFMASRSVVNAVGVARASMDWARLSCVVVGCQAGDSSVRGSHSQISVDSFPPSDRISHGSSIAAVPTLLGDNLSRTISFPLCQPGMVNG